MNSDADDPRPEIPEDARLLHDMRQPLSAVLAAASALKADPSVDDQTRERLLGIIIENTERLSDMLSQAFGRPVTPEN